MRLELTRSQMFLELARVVFREQDHLEPTMVTILSNFLQIIGNYTSLRSLVFYILTPFEGVGYQLKDKNCNLFQNLDCARCQILLSDPSDPTVFKRVFDMTKEECASLDCDLPYESSDPHDTKTYTGPKRALPVNASIASEVARTNKKVNLRNLPLGGEVEE